MSHGEDSGTTTELSRVEGAAHRLPDALRIHRRSVGAPHRIRSGARRRELERSAVEVVRLQQAPAVDTPLPPSPSSGTKARPDGTRVEQYPGNERWSKRRWAWEFLKRNDAFRAACDQLGETPDEEGKRLVCKRFGLARFRHYGDSYRDPFPKFALASVSSWTQIDGPGFDASDLPTELEAGQVLIRFDLNPALKNARALSAQIHSATQRLEKRLNYLAKALGRQLVYEKPKTQNFLLALRMSDAKASGMTRAAIARLLFPMVVRDRTDDEAAQYFKSRYRFARESIESGYLAVAASRKD